MDSGCAVILWLVAIGLSIAAFVSARNAARKSRELQQQIDHAHRLIAELRHQAARSGEVRPAAVEIKSPEPFVPVPIEPGAARAVSEVAIVDPPVRSAAPPVVPSIDMRASAVVTPMSSIDITSAALDQVEPTAVETDVTGTVIPEPPSPPLTPRADAAPGAGALLRGIDWESLIGVKLFSWIAGFAFLFGAVFFLRYTVEHGWITPPLRLVLGLVFGITLIAVCETRFARRYATTANAMDGAGIAILYATLFAGHAVWGLIPGLFAFALMIVVTGVAVFLSYRRNSAFIAILGLLGGFATPALLATGENRPVGLFGYLLVLNAGLAVVAYRKKWPALSVLSFVFTTLYQWGWTMKFVEDSPLPLGVGIFIAFPLIAVAGTFIAARRNEALSPSVSGTNALSLAMPLLFAIYVSSEATFRDNYALLFGFVTLVAVGLLAIALLRPTDAYLHRAGAIGVLLVLVVWMARSYTAAAWPAVLPLWALLAAIYLLAPILARRMKRGAVAEYAFGATVGALMIFPALLLPAFEQRTRSPYLLFGTTFLLLAVAAWSTMRTSRWRIYGVAAALTIGSAAVWCAEHLQPSTRIEGMVLVVSLAFALAVAPHVIARLAPHLRPTEAHGWLLLSALTVASALATGTLANSSLVALLLVLLLVNLGSRFMPRTAGRISVARLVSVASWVLIALWCLQVDLALVTNSSIATIAGFAALLALLEVKQGGGGSSAPFTLPLVAYGFLFVFAVDAGLTDPPAALLIGVLVVSTTMAASAVVINAPGLLVVSAVAANVVILGWSAASQRGAIATDSMLFATLIAALFIFAAEWLRRRHIGEDRHGGGQWIPTTDVSRSLGITLLALSTVVAMAGLHTQRPSMLLPLALQSVAIVGIFLVEQRRGFPTGPLLAILPSTAAYYFWRDAVSSTDAVWLPFVLFALVIYLIFVIAPIVLDHRERAAIIPYIAAALAGVPFLLFVRHSLLGAGFRNVIGLLPLFQSALMAMTIIHLRNLHRADERQRDRLVLMWVAALGYLTVAIGMQFEREWMTIGWALEIAALAWLYRHLPHRGLLFGIGGLAIVVFIRLALNPAMLAYHGGSSAPILNWYLYAYGLGAASMYAAARQLLLAGHRSRLVAALTTAGTILLFLLLNIEIADFYATGRVLTFNFGSNLAQDLTYTIGWAIFSIALLIAGIFFSTRAARISAIGLLVVTIFKCFIYDLGKLGGLYRVGAFVGLAICLAAVALLLQKFVLMPTIPQPEENTSGS